MAAPPPGPILKSDDEATAGQRLRRTILLVVVLFAAYGIYSVLSEGQPGWLKLKPAAFPARVAQLSFADAPFAAGRPYVIHLKRTGRKRKLPPQRLTLAFVAETAARYRCREPSRCPWIRIAPLSCRLGEGPPGPCGLDLFEIGQTGTKVFARPRCRLTRPGIRDLKIACPRAIKLGPKLAK
jgi:hypothetical protein